MTNVIFSKYFPLEQELGKLQFISTLINTVVDISDFYGIQLINQLLLPLQNE